MRLSLFSRLTIGYLVIFLVVAMASASAVLELRYFRDLTESILNIDNRMSDLKGDATGDNAVFVIAGHTDNAGSDGYNYDLGKKRAEAVSRYLILQKKVDPMRVTPVSYGESTPVADNSSPQGRAKNRRVEILVYREGITSEPAVAAAPGSQQQPATTPGSSQRQSQNESSTERLTQR